MFNNKVIEEIFNNHSKEIEGSVNKQYNIGDDIIIYVHQENSRIIMSALNEKTERQLYLMAAKYKDLVERFKDVGVLSTDKYYLHIDLINRDEVSKVVPKVIEKEISNKYNAVSEIDMTPIETKYKLIYTYGNSKDTLEGEFDDKELLDMYIEVGKENGLKVISLEEKKVPKLVSRIYGYCRVSSKSQIDNNSLEQQGMEILQKYPDANLFREQCTGMTIERPIFNKMVSKVSKGDILVVTKLDRLARNTKEGIEIIEELFKRGIAVHVLNIGLLEDTTMGKFFLTTMLAVSEMERNMIIERTQAGKEIARTKDGFKEGRPKKFKKVNLDHALSLLSVNGGNMSYKEVERATGISKSTLIRENNKRKL